MGSKSVRFLTTSLAGPVAFLCFDLQKCLLKLAWRVISGLHSSFSKHFYRSKHKNTTGLAEREIANMPISAKSKWQKYWPKKVCILAESMSFGQKKEYFLLKHFGHVHRKNALSVDHYLWSTIANSDNDEDSFQCRQKIAVSLLLF